MLRAMYGAQGYCTAGAAGTVDTTGIYATTTNTLSNTTTFTVKFDTQAEDHILAEPRFFRDGVDAGNE